MIGYDTTARVSGDPAVIHIAAIHIATAEPPGRVDGT
jgi:hypothetical protein